MGELPRRRRTPPSRQLPSQRTLQDPTLLRICSVLFVVFACSGHCWLNAAQVTHRQMSMIDESHRKAVVAIEFMPATIEANDVDNLFRLLVPTSSD